MDAIGTCESIGRLTAKYILDRNIALRAGAGRRGRRGHCKFFCDVWGWGDAVNVTSRMESTDEAGKVRLSEAVYR